VVTLADWIPDPGLRAQAPSGASRLVSADGRQEQEVAGWLAGGPALVTGDNLAVLGQLTEAGYPLVQLIYIDPPYNTGNTFAYEDNRRTSEGSAATPQLRGLARRHTEWVAMMRPRLVAGARLLDRTGVIYASIDHNSVHVLRLLLDEVFGPDNFIAELSVSLNPKGRQLGAFFATSHEYLLVYAKDIRHCTLHPSSTEDVRPSDFPHEDEHGRYRLLPLRNTNKKFNPSTSPTLHYPLYGNAGTGQVSHEHFEGSATITPVFGDGQPAVWRWSAAKVAASRDQLQARVVRGRRGPRVDVYQKDRWSPERTKKMSSVWLSTQVGSTDSAVAELKEELGDVFESPKPVRLLRRILTTMPDDIRVLDFFAGSGTTAVAVETQNAADDGARQYLLVEDVRAPLPGSKAARGGYARVCDVTAARMRKSLQQHRPTEFLRVAELAPLPRPAEEPIEPPAATSKRNRRSM